MKFPKFALPLFLIASSIHELPAVTVDFVPVVNAGDPGSPGEEGVVPYSYEIGRHEVTNQQYAAFLNAVAKSDPNALYNPLMGTEPEGGINRSGADGSYQYAVKAGRGNFPVNYVSIFDAWRFVNWLTNGQPAGAQSSATTESGVYHLNGQSSLQAFSADFEVWSGGGFALPNAYEWVKAAYFDRQSGSFYDYPGSNSAPVAEAAPGGSNSANYLDAVGGLTASGAYTQTTGPYGTSDQAGNVKEWTDSINVANNLAARRGGGFSSPLPDLARANFENADPLDEGPDSGFRIVRKMWGPYSFVAAGHVDTGDFLDVLWVTLDPWVWSGKMQKWLYADSTEVADGGGWIYIPR